MLYSLWVILMKESFYWKTTDRSLNQHLLKAYITIQTSMFETCHPGYPEISCLELQIGHQPPPPKSAMFNSE